MKLPIWIVMTVMVLSACGEEPEPVGPPAVTQEPRTPLEAVQYAKLLLDQQGSDDVPDHHMYRYCDGQYNRDSPQLCPERAGHDDTFPGERVAYVLPHDEDGEIEEAASTDPDLYRMVFYHHQDFLDSWQEFYYLTIPVYQRDDEKVKFRGAFKWRHNAKNELETEGEPVWGVPTDE